MAAMSATRMLRRPETRSGSAAGSSVTFGLSTASAAELDGEWRTFRE
jgi:hypothetical protein